MTTWLTRATSPLGSFCHWILNHRWRTHFLGLALIGYACFIGWHFEPVAAGSDCAGYLGSAKLLSEGKLTATKRTIPEFHPADPWPYVPLGYMGRADSTELKPTYSVGLPLHYWAASKLAGWRWGPRGVSVLTAVAAVLLCYTLLREYGVKTPLAVLGSVAFAVSPVLLYVSFIPLSDAVATVWGTAAVVFALKARRAPRWSLASGAALGIAVLVRPSNLLFLPVLVVLLFPWRTLLGAGLGGLPVAFVEGIYNRTMYGSPFQTGYGSFAGSFRFEHLGPNLSTYLQNFPFVLPLLFPALWLIPALPWKKIPRELAALLLWLALFLTFYAFYENTSDAWWNLRFLLPAFPSAVVLCLLGAQSLGERAVASGRRSWRRALPAVVLAVSLATSFYWSHKHRITHLGRNQGSFAETSAWARAHLPREALIGCMQISSSLYYYTDFPIFRWDGATPDDYRELTQALAQSHRPFYAILYLSEEEEAMKHMPGSWKKVKAFHFFTIWQYAAQ